jgi:uncharacterized coiled-coil DUF342 family protein
MATQPKDRTPRKRKPETIIRELRLQLQRLSRDRDAVSDQRFRESDRANAYQEQHRQISHAYNEMKADRDDWKRRFDALLDAVPELRKVQDDGLLRPGQLAAVAKAERAASTPQGEAAARGRE